MIILYSLMGLYAPVQTNLGAVPRILYLMRQCYNSQVTHSQKFIIKIKALNDCKLSLTTMFKPLQSN